MAQITIEKLSKIEKNRNMLHDVVEATYTTFEKNGDTYFQIDTYGKSGRENPNKVSQSIQIDKETARVLVDILKKEFSLSNQ